ncbi:hypothetical protein DNTS_020593 [Danionella cerebrum]|uniref:Uncharacterized protein n=1 Tax=Danionella cerebrum TaxID=2873325 RepID=A0A553R551_9TELE|nr:hypothetical protein DNTS_020593 [Danionella translucida]
MWGSIRLTEVCHTALGLLEDIGHLVCSSMPISGAKTYGLAYDSMHSKNDGSQASVMERLLIRMLQAVRCVQCVQCSCSLADRKDADIHQHTVMLIDTVVLEDDNAIKMIYPPPHLPISNPYIPPSIIWKMFPWQQSHYPPQVMSCLSLAEQQTVRVKPEADDALFDKRSPVTAFNRSVSRAAPICVFARPGSVEDVLHHLR